MGILDNQVSLESFNVVAWGDELLSGDAVPEQLAGRIRGALAKNSGRQSIGEATDELYLRFLTNAAVAANLVDLSVAPRWVSEIASILSGQTHALGPIVSHPSGLMHLLMDSCLLAIIPPEQDQGFPEKVINALNELVHTKNQVSHWVLDMSACKKVSSTLLAYLLGFEHALGSQSSLHLLWLRESAVPHALLPSVRKSFSLLKRGAFLVSSRASK